MTPSNHETSEKEPNELLCMMITVISVILSITAIYWYLEIRPWHCLKNVCIEYPENSLWAGKSEQVRSSLEEIISVARNTRVLDKKSPKIYAKISPSPLEINVIFYPDTNKFDVVTVPSSLGSTDCNWRSCTIILRSQFFKELPRKYIDKILSHEFTHAVRWFYHNDVGHGEEFIKLCESLYASWKKEQISCSDRLLLPRYQF